MIYESNFINNNYIGPRALFDPNYIPPKLLHRKKEENSLFSLITDSLSDNFSLNVLYQGIEGIGKKVIVNKVINDFSWSSEDPKNRCKISVDCTGKNFKDLIISLLAEIMVSLNLEFDFNYILNSNISNIWNLFKLTCKKLNNNLIIVLNNIEHLKSNSFKKLLCFGKESRVTLISTANRLQRSSMLDLLRNFDLKKKLSFFSYKELYEIIKQRVSLAFLNQIDNELIEFIVDLIFERYAPVPGKGIDILREFYPILKNEIKINQLEILDICNQHFDAPQISDEFNLLSYIAEEDVLTIIFLDNLSDHFINSYSNYYINSAELKEIYDISCETLEYDKDVKQFEALSNLLINIGILHCSKKNSIKKRGKISNFKDLYKFYFMTVNPRRLKTMIDAVFSNFN